MLYERGVGFFSAGWLRVAAEGMAAFAHNSGRARRVTSPILSEEDWQALRDLVVMSKLLAGYLR